MSNTGIRPAWSFRAALRRRRTWLLVLSVVVLVAGAWRALRPPPPKVHGRTAEAWFEFALGAPSSRQGSVAHAFSVLDDASVPVFVKALKGETGRSSNWLLDLHARLPAWLQARVPRPQSPRLRSEVALRYFPALQRDARRAVSGEVFGHFARLVRKPATVERRDMLVKFLAGLEPPSGRMGPLLSGLLDDPDPVMQWEALQLIATFAHPRDGRGEYFRDAVPKLQVMLNEPIQTNSASALAALSAIGPAAAAAVRTIEGLATEPGQYEATARALWWIDRQTNLVYKLVTESIATNPDSILLLGDFGPAARPFVPQLVSAITHPRIEIAFESVRALAQIAPEHRRLVIETLVAWVHHPVTPDDYVLASIELLGELGAATPVVRRALLQRQHDPNWRVGCASRDVVAILNLEGDVHEKWGVTRD